MKAFYAACALSFLLLMHAIAAPYRRIVPFLRPAPGRVINITSAYIHDYLSPDGKYVARISPQYGEGGEEVPSLTVFIYNAGRGRAVSEQMGAVTNFVWLPNHPHSLVAALNTDGDFLGGMNFWRGMRRTVTLRQGKGAAEDDFSIKHVSADGRNLAYARADKLQHLVLPH